VMSALLLVLAFVVFLLVRRFRGRPVGPLEGLACEEARAVTPFRNGRGVVAVTRHGREVQLSARLVEPAVPVKVGDRLRVVDVEVSAERLWVSPWEV